MHVQCCRLFVAPYRNRYALFGGSDTSAAAARGILCRPRGPMMSRNWCWSSTLCSWCLLALQSFSPPTLPWLAIRAGFCSSCVGSFVSPFVINPTDSVCERHHRLNIDLFTCSDSRGARCDLAARANIIVYNRVALMTNALYRHGSWFAQVVRRRDTSRRDQVHHFRYAAWNFSKKELKHLEFRDGIVPKL